MRSGILRVGRMFTHEEAGCTHGCTNPGHPKGPDCQRMTSLDPDLNMIVAHWSALPQEARRAVAMLVKAASEKPPQ